MGNRNTKNLFVLTDSEIKAIEVKTKMTKEEIESWHKQFLADHPTGLIDLNEFIKLHAQLFPFGNPQKYARLAFRAFDTDKSGKISFSEFLMAMSFAVNGDRSDQVKESLELTFDIYDSNNDQKIDRNELEYLLTALIELNGFKSESVTERVDQIMHQYDKTNKTFLSKDEFLEYAILDSIINKSLIIE